MTFRCANRVKCGPNMPGQQAGQFSLDYDWPLANLSSELPDAPVFISYDWGDNSNNPRTDTDWTDPNKPGLCEGSSQDTAELCAHDDYVNNNTTNNSSDGGGPGGTDSGGTNTSTGGGDSGGGVDPKSPTSREKDNPQSYKNTPQEAESECPDGSKFSYITPAGTFTSTSQELADRTALAYARKKAIEERICLGELTPNYCCVQSSYKGNITIIGNKDSYVANISTGGLPPGLSVTSGAKSVQITGTPTVTGAYTFTVEARDAAGNKTSRSYILTVAGITDTALPDATGGQPYNHTLSADGMTTPLSFQITSGSLPDGLFLDEATGNISGTPTEGDGTFTFTVLVQDSAT